MLLHECLSDLLDWQPQLCLLPQFCHFVIWCSLLCAVGSNSDILACILLLCSFMGYLRSAGGYHRESVLGLLYIQFLPYKSLLFKMPRTYKFLDMAITVDVILFL
ncbi:unnamed protein product [Ilex paraguariensis]|uniref:Uncharacterized protein n=1 Tax=Ilex paraguariensis TaxID=185542 RepID=A0ABC8TK78_9AQUA